MSASRLKLRSDFSAGHPRGVETGAVSGVFSQDRSGRTEFSCSGDRGQMVGVSLDAVRTARGRVQTVGRHTGGTDRERGNLAAVVRDDYREPATMGGAPLCLQVEPTVLCNLERSFCMNPFVFLLSHPPEASTCSQAPRWVNRKPLSNSWAPRWLDVVVKEHPGSYGRRGATAFDSLLKLPNVIACHRISSDVQMDEVALSKYR